MRPSAGVSAHSAAFLEIGSVAVPPGATVWKPPWLIELDHALNFAIPSTSSGAAVSVTSNPIAEYAKPRVGHAQARLSRPAQLHC